ncbi:hypothetical protein DBA20_05195 [Pandoraea capi]|nr:hypothetical protein [Pandoraea sp. LA3]MDN4582378.1 hypothetical protein [Pandoraea capi]
MNAPQANRPLAPIVALRSAFDPLLHDASAIIFQKIMGVDVVHKTQDGWNIATPSGAIAAQEKIRAENLMYVMYNTQGGTTIYFAQELDPSTKTCPRLPIHYQGAFGDADTVVEGRLTIVDARRVVHNAPSSFYRVNDTENTARPVHPSAEKVIVEAMRINKSVEQIESRLYVGRMIDTEVACDNLFSSLRALVNRSIEYVYLRDAGARYVNSDVPTIARLQALAVAVNTLRDWRIVGNTTTMKQAALALLQETHVTTLSKGLAHINGDSRTAAELSQRITLAYIELLSALVNAQVLCPTDIWNMLATHAGYQFSSMVGRQARIVRTFGDTYVAMLDTLHRHGIETFSIMSIVVATQASKVEGFARELCASSYRNDAGNLPKEFKRMLLQKGYINLTALSTSASRRNTIAVRPLKFCPHTRKSAEMQDTGSGTSLDRALDQFRAILCKDVLDKISLINLEKVLRPRMPRVTSADEAQVSHWVESASRKVWQEKFPSEPPPPAMINMIVNDILPGFRRDMTDLRTTAVDQIIQRAIQQFGEFLARHPDATTEALSTAKEDIIDSALQRYRRMVAGEDTSLDTSSAGEEDHGEKASEALSAAATTALPSEDEASTRHSRARIYASTQADAEKRVQSAANFKSSEQIKVRLAQQIKTRAAETIGARTREETAIRVTQAVKQRAATTAQGHAQQTVQWRAQQEANARAKQAAEQRIAQTIASRSAQATQERTRQEAQRRAAEAVMQRQVIQQRIETHAKETAAHDAAARQRRSEALSAHTSSPSTSRQATRQAPSGALHTFPTIPQGPVGGTREQTSSKDSKSKSSKVAMTG